MLWLAPRRDATIGPRCPTADLAAVPSRNLHVGTPVMRYCAQFAGASVELLELRYKIFRLIHVYLLLSARASPLPYLHLSSRVNGVKSFFFLAAVHRTRLRPRLYTLAHMRAHAAARLRFPRQVYKLFPEKERIGGIQGVRFF